MPTYDYLCKCCGHKFDDFRPVDERDKRAPCPKCGVKRRHYRYISGSIGLIFKGPGFYVNDYPKEKA
jgi:putative FmdB family regulatory protein